jgi:uncharacterized protein
MKNFILTVMALTGVILAHAQNTENTHRQKMINVSGTAEMEIVPDEIYVQIALREYAKKGGGKADIDEIRKNFLKNVQAAGIADSNISVESFQGWDGNYWWYHKNKKKNPDMMAGITYQVKLSSTKKMDELVAKLDDQATERFNISKVWHSKLDEFKKQLKMQAVKSAKEKATYLTDAIGEKIGEALIINEPNEMADFPRPMYANAMLKQANFEGAPTEEPQVDFKKMKLRFEVNVSFAIK